MNKFHRGLAVLFALIPAFMFIMGANCQGCNPSKDCSSHNQDQCKKDQRCHYDPIVKQCVSRPGEHLSGCDEIDEEEACLASKDCRFDFPTRSCLDAAVKGICANFQTEAACGQDPTCSWDKTAIPPACKDK